MEHIQRAIEKARAERDANPESLTSEKRESSAIESKTVSVNPTYSKTRSIKFTDEELKARLLFSGFAHDVRSDPYRKLRSQVLQKMRTESWRTLAITSPNAGNGKTLTALNLAICLSQEVNQTVLLVDLDLRNPSVAATLGITEIEKGIVDCALHQEPLENILISPGYNRLVIAPGTPQGHQTSEILSSPLMKNLQMEIENRYQDRFIIYDLPALLSSDDALVFAPNTDAVLLVLEDGGASKVDIEQSLKLLEGATILGTIINKKR